MRVEGTLDRKIIHGGEYARSPSYCGYNSPEEPVFVGFRPHEDGDIIVGYRLFAKWSLAELPEERNYKLCEKCLQSPDMVIRLLGCLDED